jgi:hypothetical protein
MSLVFFVVLLIGGVRSWAWLTLIATALVFMIEVALMARQRSFRGALAEAVGRHLWAGLDALSQRGGGGWGDGGDGGGGSE